MAKPGKASGSAPAASTKSAAELMKELKRFVKAMEKEDDGGGRAETYEAALRTIAALQEIRFPGSRDDAVASAGASVGGSSSGKLPLTQPQDCPVPENFLCPISSELMKDPVVVTSGQTYDRAMIENWLNSGQRTCPKTNQVLSNTILIPNLLVRNMISQWCVEHGMELLPLDVEGGLVTRKERNQLTSILSSMSASSSIPEKKNAVEDFRQFSKRSSTFGAAFTENPDALPRLLSVAAEPELKDDPQVQENAVTTIFNLSVHESNKKIIGDDPLAIPFLIAALNGGGATMDTRANAAAALSSLAALNSNKLKIVEMGAMEPLLVLLQSGSPSAKKDAGSALCNLCMLCNNRRIAIRIGIVNILLNVIRRQPQLVESLAILVLLSGHSEVADEIVETTDGMACLLNVIKEENSNPGCKENAITVLYSICMFNSGILRKLLREDIDGCISQLAENGTARARRKAAEIVDKWKKTMQRSTQHSTF